MTAYRIDSICGEVYGGEQAGSGVMRAVMQDLEEVAAWACID